MQRLAQSSCCTIIIIDVYQKTNIFSNKILEIKISIFAVEGIFFKCMYIVILRLRVHLTPAKLDYN